MRAAGWMTSSWARRASTLACKRTTRELKRAQELANRGHRSRKFLGRLLRWEGVKFRNGRSRVIAWADYKTGWRAGADGGFVGPAMPGLFAEE